MLSGGNPERGKEAITQRSRKKATSSKTIKCWEREAFPVVEKYYATIYHQEWGWADFPILSAAAAAADSSLRTAQKPRRWLPILYVFVGNVGGGGVLWGKHQHQKQRWKLHSVQKECSMDGRKTTPGGYHNSTQAPMHAHTQADTDFTLFIINFRCYLNLHRRLGDQFGSGTFGRDLWIKLVR